MFPVDFQRTHQMVIDVEDYEDDNHVNHGRYLNS